MGNNCCKRRKLRKIVLLLLGLDNAGKTRAANGLAGDPLNSPVPTVGFSVIKLKYLNYDVKIFDLGGGPNIRGIWHKYFANAHGLIFVIDSSDFSRIDEAKTVLQDVVFSDKIGGKPLLVLANKQDQENALDEIDIIEYLNIEQLVNSQKCQTLVQSCSATESNSRIDPGIQRGYEWLLNNISRNFDNLNARVETDSKAQEVQEREEMQERIKRIKNQYEIEQSVKNDDAIETYSNYMKNLTTGSGNNPQILNVIGLDEERSITSSSSHSSDISFPPLYVTNSCALPEKPKSAVQIVRHQLQLNQNSRRHSLKSRSNKTVPIHLYGDHITRSAGERRRDFSMETRNLKSAGERRSDFSIERRNLRSADERFFTKSSIISNGLDHTGAGGDYNHTKNLFEMNRLGKTATKAKNNTNDVPWVHKANGGDNAISVVEVE